MAKKREKPAHVMGCEKNAVWTLQEDCVNIKRESYVTNRMFFYV